MAVNAVQQLVNRRNAIEKELKNKEKLLASLREAHYTFWSTLRSQCSQTFHDQNCRGRVGGYPNETDSRFNINSRSDFAKWLAQDTTN